MARIAGVDLPREKRVNRAHVHLRHRAYVGHEIFTEASVDPASR